MGAAAPPRRRLRAPERREQVLDSAAEIVISSGLSALTMEAAAAAAGVSKPVVYAHFANAEELARAVAEREFSRLDAEVATRMASATTFHERLAAMTDPYLDAYLAPHSLFRTLVLDGTGSSSGGDRDTGRIGAVIGFLAAQIVAHYRIPKRDAGLAAAALYGGFEAISSYALVTNARRSDLERVLHAIVEGALRELEESAPAARSSGTA